MLTLAGLLVSGIPLQGGSTEVLKAKGSIVPYRQAEVASSVDEVITEVLVEEGDKVEEGQLLAKLDDTTEVLECEYYQLQVEKKSSDLVAARLLYEEKILARIELDKKEIESKLAETQHRLAIQRLDDKSVRAPFAGLVTRVYKSRGESIEHLEPFVQIVDLKKVYVIVYFEARELLRVKRGQRAVVTIPLYEEDTFDGMVEIVDPVVVPASGLGRVKILIENTDGRIRSGIKAHVEIIEDGSHGS